MRSSWRRTLRGVWFLVVSAWLGGSATGQTINLFDIPGLPAGFTPVAIVAGPDGNLWFTLSGGAVGRITTSGAVTLFSLPDINARPGQMTAGSDGNLWATDPAGLWRITPTGASTRLPIPPELDINGIAAGPDGNLWFTARVLPISTDLYKVGRMTTSGTLTEFDLSSAAGGITAGPDGNLWFTLDAKIGRITTAGTITEFSVPGAPSWITSGPDGNLWFTDLTANKVGRITPAGMVAEFAVPAPSCPIGGIQAGSDGNLWFTREGTCGIGRITPDGTITTFPASLSISHGLAAGPDGALWFTALSITDYTFKIGRITTGVAPKCISGGTTLCLEDQRFKLTVDWRKPDGSTGQGHATPLTDGSGYFWFFDPSNIELVVKELDGCGINQHHWVFAAGLTNIEVTLYVTDMQTGDVVPYTNSQGAAYQPVQDTEAFATCP